MKFDLNILCLEWREGCFSALSHLIGSLYDNSVTLLHESTIEGAIDTLRSYRGWYFDLVFIGETSEGSAEEALKTILETTDCTAPLLIMSDCSPEEEKRLLKAGASEVLLPEDMNARQMWRVISYMIRLRRAKERAGHLAYHDELTSLPNRLYLNERLDDLLVKARAGVTNGALILMDIDNFKTINDSLGHSVGDNILKEVATRLQLCGQTGDTVARFSGDEFVILLPNRGNTEAAAMRSATDVAQEVVAALSEPILIANYNLSITVSIGIAVVGLESATVDALFRQADTAMHEAKSQGKDRFCFFTLQMEEMVLRGMRLESLMRHGIKHNEFYLNYQPIVSADTGELLGAEALVRWNNDKLGFVSPAEFVPVAEECGLIWALGEEILEEACAFLAATPGLPQLSINISGEQIHRPNFVNFVSAIIETHRVEPGRLVFELTETTLLTDVKQAASAIRKLRGCGIKFALDDFGTGYSSLSYLKALPFDYVKIDHSFTRGVIENTDDQAIIQAILDLGKVLGFMVTAEGVETKEQREFLKDRGCGSLQGYYFSKPLDGDILCRDWIEMGVSASTAAGA